MQPQDADGVEYLALPNGEDWVMRPVLAGLIKYSELLDGTLNLIDVALLNDTLTVRAENDRRFLAYQAKKGGK